MIKWMLAASAVATGFAFAAGCYVGWKTTLKVIDSVDGRQKARVVPDMGNPSREG